MPYCWWTQRDSNPRPLGCEPNALPNGSLICPQTTRKSTLIHRILSQKIRKCIWPRFILRLKMSTNRSKKLSCIITRILLGCQHNEFETHLLIQSEKGRMVSALHLNYYYTPRYRILLCRCFQHQYCNHPPLVCT